MDKPFSDNIIFMDTEFTDLEPSTGEIISIALVKLNGESLYLELEHEGKLSDWAKEHLPTLTEEKISKEVAKEKIREFVGDSLPYPVCFVPQFDMVFLHNLFHYEDFPFDYHAVDMSTILFSRGLDPRNFDNNIEFFSKYGINLDNYEKHHALGDAKLLRDLYMNFFEIENHK